MVGQTPSVTIALHATPVHTHLVEVVCASCATSPSTRWHSSALLRQRATLSTVTGTSSCCESPMVIRVLLPLACVFIGSTSGRVSTAARWDGDWLRATPDATPRRVRAGCDKDASRPGTVARRQHRVARIRTEVVTPGGSRRHRSSPRALVDLDPPGLEVERRPRCRAARSAPRLPRP